MIIQWQQVPPPGDSDPAELRRLIAAQARAWSDLMGLRKDDFFFSVEELPGFRERAETAEADCAEAARPLVAALRLDLIEPHHQFRSLTDIQWNLVLPPEWRHAAHRTFLPDELPRRVGSWREYLAAVERGRYASYLQRLYLHRRAADLREDWQRTRNIVAGALGEGGEWLDRDDLRPLALLLLQAAVPAQPAAPLWAFWRDKPDAGLSAAVEHQIAGIDGLHWELAGLAGEWDRRAPRQQKIKHAYEPRSFEEFLADAANDDLLDLFDWLEASAAAGLACYLHGWFRDDDDDWVSLRGPASG
ncbi:MAG TPA: hypothetical protein VGE07_26420 [Herpetosiphonaceae bacterium]